MEEFEGGGGGAQLAGDFEEGGRGERGEEMMELRIAGGKVIVGLLEERYYLGYDR